MPKLATALLALILLCGLVSDAQAKETKAVYNLTVNKAGAGASTGNIKSSIGGIDCGLLCSASYDDTGGAKDVFLTATPGNGFTVSWSGNGTCVGDRCYLKMNANKAATATFASIPVGQQKINISKSGFGDGTVTSSPAGLNCSWYSWESTCTGLYPTNTAVTLQASTSDVFDGWTGACASYTGTVCIVSASGTQNVGVRFKSLYNLLIKKTGNGKGTVNLSTGATCSRDTCSYAFPSASTVTLEADPDPGYLFKGWWSPTTCKSSPAKTCLVSVPREGIEVRAKFLKKPAAFFRRTPEKRTTKTRALFTFDSTGKAKFKCSLDSAPFEKCRSPERMWNLEPGRHTYTIVPYIGETEGQSATYKWQVLKR